MSSPTLPAPQPHHHLMAAVETHAALSAGTDGSVSSPQAAAVTSVVTPPTATGAGQSPRKKRGAK